MVMHGSRAARRLFGHRGLAVDLRAVAVRDVRVRAFVQHDIAESRRLAGRASQRSGYVTHP